MTDQTDSDIFRFPSDRQYFIAPSPDTECTINAKEFAAFYAATGNNPDDNALSLPRAEYEAELARQMELDFKTETLPATIVGTEGNKWVISQPDSDDVLVTLIDSKNSMVVVNIEVFPNVVFPSKAIPVAVVNDLAAWNPEEYSLTTDQVREYDE